MAHLRASAIIFKRIITALIIPIGALSLPTTAHEVLASTVTVSRDKRHIEILQTSPIGALQNRTSPHEQGLGNAPPNYENLLKKVSTQWAAFSGGEACQFKRQAYRPLKTGHEVQFRFLFSCEEGAETIVLSAKWVEMTPPSHFIVLDIEHERQSFQTIIEERPAEFLIPSK